MYGNAGTTSFVGSASGHSIMMGGSGSKTFSITDGDAASAVAGATRSAFGITLNLTDGITINVFGVSIAASQISLG